MKNLLLATIIALASITASADVVIIEGSHADTLHDKPNSGGFLMKYGKTVNSNLEADVLYQTTQTNGTNALSTRLELGLTPSYDLNWGRVYTRAVVGEKYAATGNYTFYSYEPGVIVPLGNSGFSTKIGYRLRNAFESVNADSTRTARVGLSYAFNKQDSVALRHDRVRGDQEQNIWALSYIRSF